MAGEWEKLNGKVRAKRTKKDPPFKVLKNHRRLQSQQQFIGCIQAAIEREERFPFSPKFRKFLLEMERTSSVLSDWNIWEYLWKWSTLTGPVISVGPTELSLSIVTKLFSLVPLFCIVLTRTITRRAVAWVGSVQTECTVPLGTWALTEFFLNGKYPKCRILIAHLSSPPREWTQFGPLEEKVPFFCLTFLATTSPQTASSSPRSTSDITHHTWSRLTKQSYFCLIFLCMPPSLACEYSRFSLLLTSKDFSPRP